jgi:hypothetical protein
MESWPMVTLGAAEEFITVLPEVCGLQLQPAKRDGARMTESVGEVGG